MSELQKYVCIEDNMVSANYYPPSQIAWYPAYEVEAEISRLEADLTCAKAIAIEKSKELANLKLKLAELNHALDYFRAAIVNGSGPFAEHGFTPDQLNAVLDEFYQVRIAAEK